MYSYTLKSVVGRRCFIHKNLFRKFGLCNNVHISNFCVRKSVISPCNLIFKNSCVDLNKSNHIVNKVIYNCSNSVFDYSTSVDNKTINHDEVEPKVMKDSVKDDFYDVDVQTITNGDPDLIKALKILMLEVEVYRQEAMEVPSKLKTEHWVELLSIRTRSQKIKQLRFWFTKQQRKENDKVRKERKQIARFEKYSELLKTEDPTKPRYGLGANTFLLRITEGTMNHLANNRLVCAMKFGQDLIIDCSYDQYMKPSEQSLCAKQMMFSFATNRNHDSPFNLHFCNTDRGGRTMQHLKKLIPTMYDSDFPINVYDTDFINMFPKERLVYLTPHCRNELTTFSHDDIYIIGGIVDKTNCEPLSLAKAKSLGLRMAKFPLDRYLMWALGSKSLTLDQVVAILLEIKTSGDWTKAFEHVPKRKLVKQPSEIELEELESQRDKNPHYGQSYVSGHEWGRPKKKQTYKRRNYDIRDTFTLKSKIE